MSALTDSREMKDMFISRLQDKCKAQEGEIAALRDKIAAAEPAGARGK
jgi:hypothetical protein